MSGLANVLDWLQGKKTYLVCASAILTALVAYLNKSIGLTELIAAIFAATSQITLKAGQARGTPPSSPAQPKG